MTEPQAVGPRNGEAGSMVHPQEDKNNVLQQAREPEHQDEPLRQAGPPPYPGELVGRPEPPFEVVGLDALSPLLMHVKFPATKEEVRAQIGHAVVPIDKWRTASVAEILDKTTPETFDSNMAVEEAVKRVWDRVAPDKGRGSQHAQRDDVSGHPRMG